MKHIFYDANGFVKQVIVADLTTDVLEIFLKDYSILFGAVGVESVPPDSEVWIGWTWNGSEFIAPPEPVAATSEGITVE